MKFASPRCAFILSAAAMLWLSAPVGADTPKSEAEALQSAAIAGVNKALEVNLQICQRQKQQLAINFSDHLAKQQDCTVTKAEKVETEAQLSQCTDDGKRQRATNLTLEGDLQTCKSGVARVAAENAALVAEVARLKAELAAATEQVARLSDTLQTVKSVPGVGFAYGARGATDSLVRATEVGQVIGQERRLTAEQCGDALSWLADQAGDARAIIDRVWVWGGSTLLLCRRDTNGRPQTAAPTTPDQAHVVVYKP